MVGAHQNLNGSRDLTTPLSGMVCHLPVHLLRSPCLPNLKSLSTSITRIRKAIQNVKNGVVWG